MNDNWIMGIDLGGTQVRVGVVHDGRIDKMTTAPIPASGTVEEVIEVVCYQIEKVLTPDVVTVGIGVPSVVDIARGIVFDVQNIPSWKEVHLKSILEDRYNIPVLINNDANCFALGEKYFGKGRGVHSLVGLSIGTGIGGGIIINDRLYPGVNCGAGEFGEVKYLEHNYEYYASGQFFKNFFNTSGKIIFQRAKENDREAKNIFYEFGTHLGNSIKMILCTYDPELIVIGGSIKESFPFYKDAMWESIRSFTYPQSLEHLTIVTSKLEASGVLGAAALYYDQYQR